MELRLRRFINPKREKKLSEKSEVQIADPPSPSPTPQWPLPATGLPILPKIDVDRLHTPTSKSPIIQCVPYHAVAAAKAPIFTCEPIKGNGPIKLQTSRRSSVTGEVFVAPQDNQRTLEDILEGDYVVGRKEKRDFRGRSTRTTTPLSTPALSTTFSFSDSISFSSPRLAPQTPTSPWSLSSNEFKSKPISQISDLSYDGLGMTLSPVASVHHQSNQFSPASGINAGATASPSPPVPHILASDEQNATIAALWKAEYNRLVDIYGREHAKRKMLNPDERDGRSRVVDLTETKGYARILEAALDPLPYPNTDQYGETTRRSSNNSTSEIINHDDDSDASSPARASLASSCARSSSYTTQTSVTENDVAVTRNDIHKIINDMRATYLRALDSPSPPVPKIQHGTKKKRKNKLGRSGARTDINQTLPLDRQTWHGNESGPTVRQQKRRSKIRAISQPAGDVNRLSSVEASPPPACVKRPTNRLHRADSGTLGSLVSQIMVESEAVSTSEDEKPPREQSLADSVIIPSYLSKMISVNNDVATIPQVTSISAGVHDISTMPAITKPPGNFF